MGAALALAVLSHPFCVPESSAAQPAPVLATAAEGAAGKGPAAVGGTVQVVVVSPGPASSSARSGSSHQATIEFAFHRLGENVATPFGDVRIQLLRRDDGGTKKDAALIATEVQGLPDVVAILGPVNSGVTQELLSTLDRAQYTLPVLSSLSTAPTLTRNATGAASAARSPNFFRLIFHDADRMRWYAAYLQGHEPKVQRFVLFFENDVYGLGLRDSLEPFLDAPGGTIHLDWCELGCSGMPPSPDPAEEPTQEALEEVKNADGFVLLGVEELALRVAERIGALRKDAASGAAASQHQFFFVGQDPRYFEQAPDNAVTIGDPILDAERAPTEHLRREWAELLSEFESHSRLAAPEFLPTAYEAVLTLRAALERALARESAMPDRGALRQKLRAALESGSFASLEPWRKISFSEGDLTDKPRAPIYRIARERRREDEAMAPVWISLSTKRRAVEWGTGSIVVEAVLKGAVREPPPGLHLHADGEDYPLDFVDGRTKVQLWLPPGSHRIHTEPIPSSPPELTIEVTPPGSLALSLVLAGIGGFLASASRSNLSRGWLRANGPRILLGALSGLLLTLISFVGPDISSLFPTVMLSETPLLNAALTGLIGGVAGPGLLVGIISRVTRALGAAESPQPTAAPETPHRWQNPPSSDGARAQSKPLAVAKPDSPQPAARA